MRYRCKIEIIALILENANIPSGVCKTRLMYKTSSNPPMLEKYLSILIENDLIDYQKKDHTYTTTEKGVHFLNIYAQIKELIFVRQ
jgi:predicted transcriptional regulator